MNDEKGEMQGPPTGDEVSRRRALGLILGAAAAAARPKRLLGDAPPASARKVLVGQMKDLPPGSALTATYMEQPAIVFNAEGAVSAFSAICTHEGCVVAWNRDRRVLLCPCHGGVFDTDGEVVEGPPPAGLLGFKVVIEDDSIYLDGFRDDKE
jgi:cytochrome b6-f complex iron-sulfur subunit